ncbi:radical SAM protein [Azospirillum sp. YIM B02556]|uniref:Radical SAM protein n=1 Tax=Azospirillum endophyticum TaxID=2800326 RepID=A0ABS1FGK2_9PROT|nr:radical SAM protein [Azospirillum endophyticum]
MRIHIINPAADFPSYHTADVFAAWDLGGRTTVADLSTTTLAAFVPPNWHIRLTDEAITPLPDHPAAEDADIVAITGKVSQRNRMLRLADRYRALGRRVVIGGSYASLSPEDVRPHADVLVTGEIEDIAAELFADLAAGKPRDHYQGTRPDLRRSPLPRWDLYPNQGANLGAIQTSRGCPFQCDFCDVIQYLGRKQRHKDPDQVVAELEVLHRHGYRRVFLADDNFTVYRNRAHDMLAALRRWNEAHADAPMRFMTQVSIDLARDADLMAACKAAGLDSVFIGIETINEESLRQAGKRQNLYQSTSDALAAILSHGIAVSGGIIVGFDADGPDIFDRLAGFIHESPVPVLSVGALVAPPGTPLHDRLAAEGRLADASPQSAASPFDTNIRPARMSRRQLLDGLARLCDDIYSPAAYGRRIATFLTAYGGPAAGRAAAPQPVPLPPLLRGVLKRLSGFGPAEKRMILEGLTAARWRPDAQLEVVEALARYAQIRHMLSSARSLTPSARPAG